MFEVGLSTTGKDETFELLDTYSDAGMKYMEVSSDYELYTSYDWASFKKYADQKGVNISSLHLPINPWEILDVSSPDKEKRESAITYYHGLIKKFSCLGINKFIIHSCGRVDRNNKNDVDEKMSYASESFATLAQYAKEEGSCIAVENLPPVCLGANTEEVEKLVGLSSDIKVCLDTNHFLLGDSPIDFINHFKDRIVNVHISDYDFINERHWLPGEGKNDWYGIYDALKQVNYSGIWLYEVAFGALPTIIRDRNLTCADFLKNASEIFNKEPITVLGKPRENLGFSNA